MENNEISEINEGSEITELFDNLKELRKNRKNKNNPNNQEVKEIEICKSCNSTNFINKEGHNVCSECGLIGGIVIDTSQEWRNYGQFDNKSSDPSRCGTSINELIPNMSMGCIIFTNGKESKSMRCARNIQIWNSLTYTDTILLSSFNNMQTIASNAGINQKIIEDAKTIFKKVINFKSNIKAKKLAIQAASIQWACKMSNNSRDSDELAQLFGITNKDIRKGIKYFDEISKYILQNENGSLDENTFNTINSLDYLHRFCSKLSLNDDIYNICKNVCNFVEDNEILTRHIPLSRTASCICFTCNILKVSLNINIIKSICNCSEVTINKCIQKLEKNRDFIIENTLLKNYN
jgi:transcription initiation factor TFIIB